MKVLYMVVIIITVLYLNYPQVVQEEELLNEMRSFIVIKTYASFVFAGI